MVPWVVEVLRWVTRSHLSPLFHFGSGSSAVFFLYHQGYTVLGELEGSIAYGDVELVPFSSGFYCHLFIDSFSFRVLATTVELVISLLVCSSDSFWNGITPFCPSRCSEVHLDDLIDLNSGFSFILTVASFFGLLWPDCISVSRLVLRSLIGFSYVHLCHDSRVGHVSQPGRQDVTLSSRLALSRLFFFFFFFFSIGRLYR